MNKSYVIIITLTWWLLGTISHFLLMRRTRTKQGRKEYLELITHYNISDRFAVLLNFVFGFILWFFHLDRFLLTKKLEKDVKDHQKFIDEIMEEVREHITENVTKEPVDVLEILVVYDKILVHIKRKDNDKEEKIYFDRD